VKIRFGPCTLDLDTRQLLRNGSEIHLTPKAYALLEALISERPKVVSKADLQQRLWPDTFVVEANLSSLIAEVRTALGDRPRAARFIRTVHGFGYAFCADATIATIASGPRAATPVTPSRWLQWGKRHFPLPEGDHVIGRDPDVDIRLDASTVSRRHARLVVDAKGVLLEDFGSKNGTYHGERRVTSPVPLADGDDIRIGSVRVTFHSHSPQTSTETQSHTGR
jgi:DNA-binding winged helix-turn-helix (wHTH) protein